MKMKYFFGFFLLFLIACGQSISDQQKNASGNNLSSAKKLKTGIYLQVDSLTPGAIPFTVDKPSGKVYYVDTTPLLNENDFQNLAVDAHGISFDIEFTDQGALRYESISETAAGKVVDVIIDNRLIGSYFILRNEGSRFLADNADSVGIREGLLAEESWTKHISDSLNKIWGARLSSTLLVKDIVKEFYDNGKMFKQEKYADTILQWSKKYFESGSLAYEYFLKDTLVNSVQIASYEKEYFPNGNLAEEYYGNRPYTVLYRIYYKNGKLKEETVGPIGFYTGPEFIRNYSENGSLEHEEHVIYPDQLPCGDKGEFNHPRIYHEKTFNENDNKVACEEEYYSNCGECDQDSCGLWKYYDDGKLIRTKKFPSWQELYKRACSGDKD